MLWVILLASAVAVVVFIERALCIAIALQINSAEFLNGVRTVLKRDNVVEALSICDATPGPVARLVKTAILNRDYGRGARPRIAGGKPASRKCRASMEKLNLLATIAQIAPLLGLLGTVLGMIRIFSRRTGAIPGVERQRANAFRRRLGGAYLHGGRPRGGHSGARGAIIISVSRVNEIVVLDMEKAATEIVNIVIETPNPKGPWRSFRATPGFFAASSMPRHLRRVFFPGLVIFVLLTSLVYTPGVHIAELPRRTQAGRQSLALQVALVTVAVDKNGRLAKYKNQIVSEADWKRSLEAEIKKSSEPLTLVLPNDEGTANGVCVRLAGLARSLPGIKDIVLQTLPRPAINPAKRP